MKKIYIEKIHQATRFGLIDEDGRKTPCGTLWSDAQLETFKNCLTAGTTSPSWCGAVTAQRNPPYGRSGRTLGGKRNSVSSARSDSLRRWKSLSKLQPKRHTATNAAQRAETMNVLTDTDR